MKRLIALSAVAALATAGFASEADLQQQIDKLKEQVSQVKAQSANDNIKFGVDYRTSYDYISYKTASGKEYTNDALLSNRLWLNMGYAPSDRVVFIGQLSYNKAFGATPPGDSTSTGFPQRGFGFDGFDWVVNENLSDNSLKVREAYWLYIDNTGLIPWTASVGRRPATNGFLVNLRDDDKAKSPLGHVINMEFDGASFKFGLDKMTDINGMYFKVCLGRGLTNANARFTQSGLDYAKDGNNLSDNVDMAGFIFVPYSDGQYTVETTYYRGFNVPGVYGSNVDMADPSATTYNFASVGDQDGAAISIMADGVGEGISDFLDETILFASFAWSQTNPDTDTGLTYNLSNHPTYPDGTYPYAGMLGSTEKESGTSIWVGAQIPAMITEDGRFGIEYNQGSKYWRPFTYGEDTMIGSKLAARGTAYEAYYTQPLATGLSMQVRATYIDYDYTGSQGFFAQGGTPVKVEDAAAAGFGDAVDKATDIRAYIRYRF